MLKLLRQKLYSFRHDFCLTFKYPDVSFYSTSYDFYWSNRLKSSPSNPNFFHKYRSRILKNLIHNSFPDQLLLFDIGSGDGRQLSAITSTINRDICITASDISTNSINYLSAHYPTIQITNSLDYIDKKYHLITAFEVLEHLASPEATLFYALENSDQFHFSVPNTGFISYRLRLLSGKFPLQWRSFPGEHIRFWTFSDMKWWLFVYLRLNKDKVKIILYPTNIILNLFPFLQPLFCKGLYVTISSQLS